MTINLTELRDEPLGKHPIQCLWSAAVCYLLARRKDRQPRRRVAADDESSFTFDVDGLSDEALDRTPRTHLQCVRFPLRNTRGPNMNVASQAHAQ